MGYPEVMGTQALGKLSLTSPITPSPAMLSLGLSSLDLAFMTSLGLVPVDSRLDACMPLIW